MLFVLDPFADELVDEARDVVLDRLELELLDNSIDDLEIADSVNSGTISTLYMN